MIHKIDNLSRKGPSVIRLMIQVFLVCVISVSSAQVVWSQDDNDDSSDTDSAASSEDENSESKKSKPKRKLSKQGSWPSVPVFTRGTVSPNGRGGSYSGFYLSLWSLGIMIALLAAWLHYSRWLYKDSTSLKVRSDFWCSIVMVTGVVGFLVGLCMTSFITFFFTALIINAIPFGLYVKERNDHVPDNARILTKRHLKIWSIRTLGKIGIHLGSKDVKHSAIGPPIQFLGKAGGGKDEDIKTRQVENSSGYLSAKDLIYDAIMRRSTDVHLEPKDEEMSVRLRVDGVMYPSEPFDINTGVSIVNIFKVLGGMDISLKRKPQDGSFRAILEGRDIDFRAATQRTQYGEKISIRILDQSASVNNLQGLGLRKPLFESLRSIIHQPHGLFLCCGPTGAGKSTTLFSALSDIDSYQRNVITVEDPIEYRIPNVNQIEINAKAGQTFSTSLRSILRQDPDVIMIGEIRDGETAEIACQAANTGHMVFSTIHANDTITALYRLMELGVDPFMVANSISGILAQRLARRLCTACREPYKPNPELLKKLRLPVDKIEYFYRQNRNTEVECEECGGLGYKGRVGVFELLVINDRLRDLIRDKTKLSAVKAEARKNGMLYMREEGLRLLARGITTIDELQRVVR